MKYFFIGIFLVFQLFLSQTFASFRIAKFKDDKSCAISYTFDDGLLEHATLVAPKMEKLGFRATFWVNGKTIDENNDPVGKPRVSWKQLRQMAARGHEISNHGWAHKNFNRLNKWQMKEEIDKNDSAIFVNTGVYPVTFCYPFNAKNDSAIALASVNRVGTRTEQFSVGGKSTPENLESRIQDLIQNNEWGVTMTHGINDGYDHFTDSQIFWEHLESVQKQEDKIWVGTFREVGAYVKERENIVCAIDTIPSGFIITPVINLDKKLFSEHLTGVFEFTDLKRITILQGNKKLKVKILNDKILFDFDPFGGKIQVTTMFKERNKRPITVWTIGDSTMANYPWQISGCSS